MIAMVLKAKNTPFVLETVPDPVPGPGEAVARVLACGAGLTIHHTRVGRVAVNYPRIIGHEITGEIVALGQGATELKTGDAVTAYFYLTCGRCHWCRVNRETLCDDFGGYVGREVDGGYAEYIKLPAKNFIKLPPGLDWRKQPAEIGVICDAIATPVKVIRKARVTPNDAVVVFGAGGGLGVHMLMLARWARARKVIAVDVMASKFETCLKAGADATVDASDGRVAEQLMELTGGKGVDVAIDFVCTRGTLEAAFTALGKGGRLVALGGHGQPFQVQPAQLLRKEIEVLGSRYATRQEVLDSLDLVARGEFFPIVTEKVALEQAEAIHQRIEKGLITGRAAIVMS
ncbi:MAG: zinc-binding dehydrogenase [Betaproteobacteria bacterium]|nr:zinc-binding dehydrogenase [Betaproteobacteria bacterium]